MARERATTVTEEGHCLRMSRLSSFLSSVSLRAAATPSPSLLPPSLPPSANHLPRPSSLSLFIHHRVSRSHDVCSFDVAARGKRRQKKFSPPGGLCCLRNGDPKDAGYLTRSRILGSDFKCDPESRNIALLVLRLDKLSRGSRILYSPDIEVWTFLFFSLSLFFFFNTWHSLLVYLAQFCIASRLSSRDSFFDLKSSSLHDCPGFVISK